MLGKEIIVREIDREWERWVGGHKVLLSICYNANTSPSFFPVTTKERKGKEKEKEKEEAGGSRG